MIFPISAVLTILTLVCAVSADGHKCETTDGSPKASDCQHLVDKVLKEGSGVCYDLNPHGSGCRKLKEYGSCAVVACIDAYGPPPNVRYLVEGSAVKKGANDLLKSCPNDLGGEVRVGGYYRFNDINPHQKSCTDGDKDRENYVHIEFVKN
ncbi:hypothetical protein F5B20DRAFT_201850 [Whalleya microplaca]|nr:hypothetical protein F5B20DRAFT_201850 [Whalleya microplaca]